MAQLRDLAAAAVRRFDLKNKKALPYAYHGLHHLVRSQIAHRRALMRDHCTPSWNVLYLRPSSALKSASTPARAANPAVQPCEGRSQELNGDLTWRGVYESARPPVTASPHLVQARSRRFITSFVTRDAAARASVKTMDDFNRKGLAAPSVFEMTR